MRSSRQAIFCSSIGSEDPEALFGALYAIVDPLIKMIISCGGWNRWPVEKFCVVVTLTHVSHGRLSEVRSACFAKTAFPFCLRRNCCASLKQETGQARGVCTGDRHLEAHEQLDWYGTAV